MYKNYFGFKEEPFSIAPDPQFLYMSERYREALAHLIYGMKADSGFVLLTGEVGTGKTTVCRCLLGQIPENSEIAFILNPKLSAIELLATLCDELGIPYQGELSIKILVDLINTFLLKAHAEGRRTVLIIDEAQNLSIDVLEQIRLLTNLETDKQKLLQIIMLGQPELNDLLAKPELRQLAQRITARYHLEPLGKDELPGYLNHRLAVAGVERPLFSAAAVRKLYALTEGVPRLINLLCDRALLGAYAKGQSTIDPQLITQAGSEIFGRREHGKKKPIRPLEWFYLVLLSLILVIGCAFVFTFMRVSEPFAQQSDKQIATIQSSVANAPLQWNSKLPISGSSVAAYRELFRQWGVDKADLRAGAKQHAIDLGLRLVTRRGSLGLLRQLDRPAVLKLNTHEGQPFHATLIAIDGDEVTVRYAEQTAQTTVTQLMRQWFGDYGMLWKPPQGYSGTLRPGASSALIPWLDQTMAVINDRPQNPGVRRLEGTLLQEIRDFQHSAGLEADGVVGSHTLIMLNSRVENGRPTLSADR